MDGKAPITICVGGSLEVIDALARLTGKDGTLVEIRRAESGCFGINRLDSRFHYDGPQDCRAAAMLTAGHLIVECVAWASALALRFARSVQSI